MVTRKQTQSGEIIIEMQVVDAKGVYIGEVKEIRDGDFLVDRSFARDLYIPHDSIEKIEYRMVFLGIPKKEMDKQGWLKPALFS